MNMEEAYAEGFLKTAEAYGVDPDWLLKIAQGTVAGMNTRSLQSPTASRTIASGNSEAIRSQASAQPAPTANPAAAQAAAHRPVANRKNVYGFEGRSTPRQFTYDDFQRRAVNAGWTFDPRTQIWTSKKHKQTYDMNAVRAAIARKNRMNGARSESNGASIGQTGGGVTVMRNMSSITPAAQGNDFRARAQNMRRQRQLQAVEDNRLGGRLTTSYDKNGARTYTYTGTSRGTPTRPAGWVDDPGTMDVNTGKITKPTLQEYNDNYSNNLMRQIFARNHPGVKNPYD